MTYSSGDQRPAALVFGGSRGIGAATATRLAADGLRVALTYASRTAHPTVGGRRNGVVPRRARGGHDHRREPHGGWRLRALTVASATWQRRPGDGGRAKYRASIASIDDTAEDAASPKRFCG
ncbi:hypothetical protein GCM10007036_43290 [Alsobacter metallidurans]|uniref:Uncharacterized protein n=1 Tax=Alsobacter metallidurans TaxID=340221 RepID=A0A917IAW8_9HYPH|nr:hypothetical protein GCM10007036_43290 [Alsobacter metallidurans]